MSILFLLQKENSEKVVNEQHASEPLLAVVSTIILSIIYIEIIQEYSTRSNLYLHFYLQDN